MAINWTMSQAVKTIREGKDLKGIIDITRRFPLFALAVAKGENGMVHLLESFPNWMTARKAESVLKSEDTENESEEEIKEEEEEVVPTPKVDLKSKKEEKGKEKGKKVVEPEPEEEEEETIDYRKLSEDELKKLCKMKKIKFAKDAKKKVLIKLFSVNNLK